MHNAEVSPEGSLSDGIQVIKPDVQQVPACMHTPVEGPRPVVHNLRRPEKVLGFAKGTWQIRCPVSPQPWT